jgi:Ca-activated chloride channel family protein
MNFAWPYILLLLLLIPLLIALYIWILRRKRKYAVRYSSLSLIREALPKHTQWRKHLPFALFLVSTASLIIALARPHAVVELPLSRTTIILAVDVSRSMCATDVDPNRLTIAQEAALAFIEEQADDTRIGIVAFAGFAEIVVPPTNDKAVLKQAIENFTTSIGTAIGSATLRSIDAIAEINDAVALSGVDLSSVSDGSSSDVGFYQPDIIVVLTDGANSRGPLPLDAAQQAADRLVRIYTIGFGSTEPEQMVCTPQQLGSDSFSGSSGGGGFSGGGFRDENNGGGSGGFGGYRRFLLLDEPTLQGMADLTGGTYYRAEDAEQLYDVFVNLPNEIVLQKEKQEISVFFAMFGAFFIICAIAFSWAWRRFP